LHETNTIGYYGGHGCDEPTCDAHLVATFLAIIAQPPPE